MRGDDRQQQEMWSYVSAEERVPQDHPLRPMRKIVNGVLRDLSPLFERLYSKTGRPSIPPERLLRALLLQMLYTIRSERLMMEQLDYNILFRWFVGLEMDDPVWAPTVFTKNRDRLLDDEVAEAFFNQVLEEARKRKLLSDEHFTVVLTFAIYLTVQRRRLVALRRELAEGVEQHADRLLGLLSVSRIMGAETDPQAVFEAITQTCRETLNCDQVSLMLVDRDGGDLIVRSAAGHDDLTKVLGARQKLDEGFAGHAATKREPLLLGRDISATRFSGIRRTPAGAIAAMVVPIILRGELIGVLNVGSRSGGVDYDEDDLRALQVFAENAGTCIRHAEQAQWMRELIKRSKAPLGSEMADPEQDSPETRSQSRN